MSSMNVHDEDESRTGSDSASCGPSTVEKQSTCRPTTAGKAKNTLSEIDMRRLSEKIGSDWKRLASHLGFQNARIEGFQHDNRDLMEQIFQMLVSWLRSNHPDEDARSKLAEAFTSIDCAYLLPYLLECSSPTHKSTDPAAELEAADRCAEEVKKLYRTKGSYVQLNPLVDDDTVHVRDIFTKVKLHATDKNSISFEDIFNIKAKQMQGDLDLVKRAILNGSTGKGKTTLFGKITCDWAIHEAIQQFKLVFALKMSKLNQSSDLIEVIFDQLLAEDTHVDRRDLEFFIENNPDKVLIMLDGFDELTTTSLCEDKFGSILKILNRKKLRECWVVISTRPSHLDKLVTKSLIQKPYTHVKVLGFDDEDVDEYVGKFYTNEPAEKGDGLLKRIKSSHILSDLAKTPMLILLLCLLWRVGSTIPETLWGIYNEAVKYIFQRKGHFSLEEISRILIEIGKIGLRGLLSPDQSLSFNETEFDKSVLDKAIQAGILTRQRRVCRGIEPTYHIEFIHMTMQEFCGAKYFQDLFHVDNGAYQRTLNIFSDFLRRNHNSLENLLRFCCGDNEACMNDILQTYQVISLQYKDDRLKRSILSCYFEGQSESLPPENIISVIIQNELNISCYSNEYLMSFTYFVKCLAKEPSDKEKDFIGKVHTLRLELSNSEDINHIGEALRCMNNLVELNISGNIALSSSSVSWSYHLKYFKKLQKLDMSRCNLRGKDMNHSVGEAMSSMQLEELNLSGNVDLGGSLDSWIHHLQGLTGLLKLNMSRCWLTSEDMDYIAKALICMTNLVELNLMRNLALGNSSVSWEPHFRQLKHLQVLNMRQCWLKGEDMIHIGEAMNYMNKVVELDLSRNCNLGGSLYSWSHHLKHLKKLKKFNMSLCRLTSEDMNLIDNALSCKESLVELNLGRNIVLDGTSILCNPRFANLNQLQKLDLSGNLIGQDDMNHIGEANELVELILSGNCALGSSSESWSPHLKQLTKLQTLDISRCWLTGDDMNHFGKVLSSMNNLLHLDLSKNVDIGGSSELWSQHLQHLNRLRTLNMSDCEVTGEDMSHIGEAFSSMINLVDLKLSHNVDLRGSSESWSHHLKLLIKLKKLDISVCNLIGEDMNYIVEALSSIDNFVELNLSGNGNLVDSSLSWSHKLKGNLILIMKECRLSYIDINNIEGGSVILTY